jgi:hypothetical protein
MNLTTLLGRRKPVQMDRLFSMLLSPYRESLSKVTFIDCPPPLFRVR